MVRKPPRLPHVKFVRAKGKTYAYFNTGQKLNGKPIYARLPDWGSTGFFDSYAAFKAGRTKRKPQGYTVRSLARDYQQSGNFRDKRPNTQRAYRQHLANILDAFEDYPANELQPADVQFVLDNGKFGWGMHNGFLAVLGAMYTWGRKSQKTTGEPTKDIDRRSGGSHMHWPEETLERGLQSQNDTIRLAVHLLYFTGQRIGDVCAMRWADMRDGFISITQEKTRKTLDIPVHSELRAEIERIGKRGITILTGANGAKLKPPYLAKAMKKELGLVGLVPHGLRKNAVNVLLEAGCPTGEVAAITGQTFAIVEQYAARVNRKKMASAAMLKFEKARQ